MARRSFRASPNATPIRSEPLRATPPTPAGPEAESAASGPAAALVKPVVLALERRRAYGPAHPMAAAAEAALRDALDEALRTTGRLELQVVPDRLLVDGVALAGVPLARELAQRLHRRGIAAVAFAAPLPADSLHAFLGHVVGDGATTAITEAWAAPGIDVAALRYDQLALGEGAAQAVDDAVAACWRALAQVATLPVAPGGPPSGTWPALGSGHVAGGIGSVTGAGAGGGTGADGARAANGAPGTGVPTPVPPPERIAGVLGAAPLGAARARSAAQAIVALAEATAAIPGMRAQAAERLHEVLQRIGAGTFAAIVRDLDSAHDRRRLLGALSEALPLDAIATWLHAAASAQGQELSHQLLRLVGKLARTDGRVPPPVEEEALRASVRELVEGWTLDDPNPLEHVRLLEAITAHEAALAGVAAPVEGALRVEHDRVVAFALEADVDLPVVRLAAAELASSGELRRILDWLRTAPPNEATRALHATLLSDEMVHAVLTGTTVDPRDAEAIVGALGADAVEVLVDVLGAAPLRDVRRVVLARLRELGDAIVGVVAPRIASAPAPLARNLLVLMRDLHATAGGVVQAALRRLEDPEPIVRAEAVRYLTLIDAARAEAVLRALRDDQPRIVRIALGALVDHAPKVAREVVGSLVHDDLVAAVLRTLAAPALDERTRAGAVLAAGALGGPRVRDRLVALVVRRTAILRRRKLVAPGPVAVAALHVLRRDWRDDAVAAPALTLAQKEARDARWRAVPTLPTEEERP